MPGLIRLAAEELAKSRSRVASVLIARLTQHRPRLPRANQKRSLCGAQEMNVLIVIPDPGATLFVVT